MSIPSCCLKTFSWNDTPTGHTSQLTGHDTYIAGSSTNRAILLIPDLLGWTFPNTRLLADHFAAESDATVYLVDFFQGEQLPFEPLLKGEFHKVDLEGFTKRHWRDIREAEIFNCAHALRQQYKFVGAVGYCYGGWAVFRLGAKEHNPPLVDAVCTGHPTWLTKKDIDEINVPVQMLAPEQDPTFTPELKMHAFETLQKNGVMFDYQHFPGVEHACFTRGDPDVKGEREAMARGKDAAVNWFSFWLRNGY